VVGGAKVCETRAVGCHAKLLELYGCNTVTPYFEGKIRKVLLAI
jgi:hypothetical protein